VRRVIESERPDRVCVELDERRYEALSQKTRWEQLDLKQLIRNKQLAPLLAQLMLASYQKKLGGALGILPGAELLEATVVAKELDIPIELCDRDVRVTLRRAWAAMPFHKKALLISQLIVSTFDRPEIDEDELRRLRQQDVLSELMREIGEALPTLKRTLIDERDDYLSQKLKDAAGQRLVAVVGAGHVQGILEALQRDERVDLAEIERIPPVSPTWKYIGWSIPVLFVCAIAYIGITRGAEVASQNLVYWILANGIPSTLGAIIALAHPLTIVSAFFVAPVTSLIPIIGAGYVLAFLQAYVQPPVVKEFETLTDDIGVASRWWSSRMLRVLLVFILTTLGSIIGTYVGGYEILSNLFGE